MVRTSHRTINWFKVGKIVRHGTMDCSKLVKEYIKAELQNGIKVSGRNINNLRYADDTEGVFWT